MTKIKFNKNNKNIYVFVCFLFGIGGDLAFAGAWRIVIWPQIKKDKPKGVTL